MDGYLLLAGWTLTFGRHFFTEDENLVFSIESTVGNFAVTVDTFAGAASGFLGNLLTTEII